MHISHAWNSVKHFTLIISFKQPKKVAVIIISKFQGEYKTGPLLATSSQEGFELRCIWLHNKDSHWES